MKPLTMSEEQWEMVERQVSLGRSFLTAFADLDHKEQSLLLLADEVDALRTKLAETEAMVAHLMPAPGALLDTRCIQVAKEQLACAANPSVVFSWQDEDGNASMEVNSHAIARIFVAALHAQATDAMANEVVGVAKRAEVALAASQAEVRELIVELAKTDRLMVAPAHVTTCGAWILSGSRVRPLGECTCGVDAQHERNLAAISARPTSDTALRGLCERVLKLADKHGERSHEDIVNEVLGEASPRPDGPGAEPGEPS